MWVRSIPYLTVAGPVAAAFVRPYTGCSTRERPYTGWSTREKGFVCLVIRLKKNHKCVERMTRKILFYTYYLWCLHFIANLMGLRITMETCLSMKMFTRKSSWGGRPILTLDSTVPLAGVPDWIKGANQVKCYHPSSFSAPCEPVLWLLLPWRTALNVPHALLPST